MHQQKFNLKIFLKNRHLADQYVIKNGPRNLFTLGVESLRKHQRKCNQNDAFESWNTSHMLIKPLYAQL